MIVSSLTNDSMMMGFVGDDGGGGVGVGARLPQLTDPTSSAATTIAPYWLEMGAAYQLDNDTILKLNAGQFNVIESLELKLLGYPAQQERLSTAIPLTVILALILITGCVGNLCTAIVIARPKNKYMHTATNYYLFSLAMSDFMLLILGLPLEIFDLWQKWPFPFGESFCILRGYLSEMSTYASIMTISAFTVERYVAICHPLWAHTMSQLPRAITTTVIIWCFAALSAIAPAAELGIITKQGPITNQTIEASAVCHRKRPIYEYMFAISGIVFFLIPMIIVTVLYILIAIELRRSRKMNGTFIKKQRQQQQEAKFLKQCLNDNHHNHHQNQHHCSKHIHHNHHQHQHQICWKPNIQAQSKQRWFSNIETAPNHNNHKTAFANGTKGLDQAPCNHHNQATDYATTTDNNNNMNNQSSRQNRNSCQLMAQIMSGRPSSAIGNERPMSPAACMLISCPNGCCQQQATTNENRKASLWSPFSWSNLLFSSSTITSHKLSNQPMQEEDDQHQQQTRNQNNNNNDNCDSANNLISSDKLNCQESSCQQCQHQQSHPIVTQINQNQHQHHHQHAKPKRQQSDQTLALSSSDKTITDNQQQQQQQLSYHESLMSHHNHRNHHNLNSSNNLNNNPNLKHGSGNVLCSFEHSSQFGNHHFQQCYLSLTQQQNRRMAANSSKKSVIRMLGK